MKVDLPAGMAGDKVPRKWFAIAMTAAITLLGCESVGGVAGAAKTFGVDLPIGGHETEAPPPADPLGQCWRTVDKLIDRTATPPATAAAQCDESAELAELKAKVAQLETDLAASRREVEVVQDAAETYSSEVDRLEAENSKLRARVLECVIGGDDG